MSSCKYNKEEECTECNDRCDGNDNCLSQEEQDYEDWKDGQ